MNPNHGMTLLQGYLNPVSDFRREFDRLFDDWLTPTSRAQRNESHFVPLCDIAEHDDHFLLSLEMAGVKKEDIKMEAVDNQILISGERRDEVRRQEEGQIYSERRFGKFQRSFSLPAGVDTSQIEAHYQDGILRVLIPKTENTKPRQIKITNGSGGSKFFGKILGQPKEKEETHPSPGTNQVAS